MKFLCSHCKAKYQIADERLQGRTLRMVCRSCGQEIVVRSDNAATVSRSQPVAPPSMPAPPSPLGAEFQAGGASVHPGPPAVPIDEWHVAIDDQPVGPMRREEVARRLAAGGLGPESLAWREGLDDWMPIRQIPELVVLCPPSPLVPNVPLPPSPIGGRAGAAPAYTLDDWGPVADRSSMLSNPLHDVSQPPSGPRMPSMPMMFAVACGFAFLMSLLTIFGARWLREQPPATAANGTATPAQPAANQPQPDLKGAVAENSAGAGGNDMTIELGDTQISGSTRRPAQGTGATNSAQTGKGKKPLTEEQKAMLARMGGTESSDLGALQRASQQPSGSGPKAAAGSLTADQLRGVVQRGRKNLQRCYEVASRGVGSDSTVRLDVQITVSPSGNVTAITTNGTTLPGMNDCIARTIKMWRFPAAGDATSTKFPLLFQPGA